MSAEVVQAERGREPQQREVMQDRQLVVRERQHAVPGLDLRHGIVERHVAVAGKARDDHREVLHQRRVHHVAEVDHADDLIGVRPHAQQVVGVPIAVDDLRAQPGQVRQQLALQARVQVRAERLRVLRDPGLHAGLHQQRALDVPRHEVPGMWMEKALQPACESCLKRGSIAKRGRSKRLTARERCARNPAEQPNHVARAVCGGDPLKVLARFRRDDARYGQVRRMALEVAQRGDLEFHGTLAFTRRGDLQHMGRPVGGRQTVVLVALTVEWREFAFQAPMFADKVHELSERELGGIEVQIHGAERPLQGDIHSVRLRRRSIVVAMSRHGISAADRVEIRLEAI